MTLNLVSDDGILTRRLHLLHYLHTLEGILTLALSPTQALLRAYPARLAVLTFLHLRLTTCTSRLSWRDTTLRAPPTFP